MAASINITDLQKSAVQYQMDLQFLPYAVLVDALQAMGINLFPGVEYKDRIIQFQRKGGNAKPYYPGLTISKSDLGKMTESELIVEKAYSYIEDNIMNYKEKQIIRPGEKIGQNLSKALPFEQIIMREKIKTFGEDLLDALFPGARNTADGSPLGCFDGFDTLIDARIADGEVALAEGNYAENDAIEAPTSESDIAAWTRFIAWLRKADLALLDNANLLLPRGMWTSIKDACFNKYRFTDFSAARVVENINDTIGGNVNVISPKFMGTGTRMMLIQPGIMDFGMNTLADVNFVQVLPPAKGDDPNEFGYWIQGDFGTRIRLYHKKSFMVNNGTPVANALAGDYRS